MNWAPIEHNRPVGVVIFDHQDKFIAVTCVPSVSAGKLQVFCHMENNYIAT